MSDPSAFVNALIGREVAVDVSSPFIYIGTLVALDHKYLVFEDADVHDLRDSNTNRELYILDARRHGNRPNRRRVLVSRHEIVSLSALDDVIA